MLPTTSYARCEGVKIDDFNDNGGGSMFMVPDATGIGRCEDGSNDDGIMSMLGALMSDILVALNNGKRWLLEEG